MSNNYKAIDSFVLWCYNYEHHINGKGDYNMFCPNCGMENAEGAAFCASCGSAMNAAPIQQDVPEVTPVEETVETTESCKKCPLAPLWEKIQPYFQKYKLFVVGALGVIALILCISILASLFSSNGFIAFKRSINVDVNEGEVFIIVDAKKGKTTGLEADSISDQQVSLDGTIVALLTNEGDLAVVKGTKLVKVASEVSGFIMSEDGTGIAYVVREDGETELFLYNVKNKKSTSVTTDLYRNSYLVSPDGDSLVYYEKAEDDEEAKVMYFKGKKSTKVASGDVSVLGLSNNGKFIYGYARNDDGDTILYRYNKKGDRDKIGSFGGSSYVYFNADHTQILYMDEGKSYISKNGKEGVKIASSSASLLIPESSSYFYNGGNYATCPTDDLFNKVYSCDGNLWFIRKNADKSVKLANDASGVTLSEDAKLVYYINKGELKVLKVKHGDNASDKAKVLCDEEVSNYVVTSDCKKVYYVNDGSLYVVNGKTGKGKKTIANDDVSSRLAINGKDVVYYAMEGDVYATTGRKGKKVVSDAEGMENTANGIVYIVTDDTIYATKGAKKPSKIFTID